MKLLRIRTTTVSLCEWGITAGYLMNRTFSSDSTIKGRCSAIASRGFEPERHTTAMPHVMCKSLYGPFLRHNLIIEQTLQNGGTLQDYLGKGV